MATKNFLRISRKRSTVLWTKALSTWKTGRVILPTMFLERAAPVPESQRRRRQKKRSLHLEFRSYSLVTDCSSRLPLPLKLQVKTLPAPLPPNRLPRNAVARRPTPTMKQLRLPRLRRPEERRPSSPRLPTPMSTLKSPTSSLFLRRRPPRARRLSRQRRLPTSMRL